MYIHFSLTILLCILNLMPIKPSARKNWILPLSFILIGLFMGLRYDYGLDYWNYYNEFYHYGGYRENESLFWIFFFSFDKYYKYILVKSLLLSGCCFYLVRKYVPVNYYAFFIFFFMTNSSLIYTMMTAERTCMGAMVFWMGLELFYFKKKRLLLLCGTIIIAAFFHTVLLLMLIVPAIDFIYENKNPNKIIVLLVLALIAGMFTQNIFSVVTENELFSNYAHYSDEHRFLSKNIFGVIVKGVPLITIIYLLLPIKYNQKDNIYTKFLVLSVCYFMLNFSGAESDGRLAICLLPFFVIILTQRLPSTKTLMNIIALVLPFLYITLTNLFIIYERMIKEPWLPGNYMTYQTIFEVGFFE